MIWCSWCCSNRMSEGYQLDMKQLQGKCECESCGCREKDERYFEIKSIERLSEQ